MASAAAQHSGHWASSEDADLDGRGHYRALGLAVSATTEEVKAAFHAAAREAHPDKGGSSAAFAAVRRAFEVLSDPAQRRAYDALGCDVRSRFLRQHTAPASAAARPAASSGAGGSAVAAEGLGGEGALLSELARQLAGQRCDPLTQLVVTCEVCRRPATLTCWICSAPICSFCTRRQHWKGVWPLHWPMVNSPHMEEKLGRREMEVKRKEDAARYEQEDPAYMPPAQLREARRFQEDVLRTYAEAGLLGAAGAGAGAGGARASSPGQGPGSEPALDAAGLPHDGPLLCGCPRLSRYYRWCQTQGVVYLACHVPTARAAADVLVEASRGGGRATSLRVRDRGQGGLPVLHRAFAHAVDPGLQMETVRSADGRTTGIMVAKARRGERWRAAFAGDSDGARCADPPLGLDQRQHAPEGQAGEAAVGVEDGNVGAGAAGGGATAQLPAGCIASYSLMQLDDEVVLELQVPFWVRPEDVTVRVSSHTLHVAVDGLLNLTRTFWETEPPPPPPQQQQQQQQQQADGTAVVLARAMGMGREAAAGGKPPTLPSASAAATATAAAAASATAAAAAAAAAAFTPSSSPGPAGHASGGGYQAVVPEQCTWTLSAVRQRGGTAVRQAGGTAAPQDGSQAEGAGVQAAGRGLAQAKGRVVAAAAAAGGRQPQVLSICLALPPANAEEVTYKKGVRQDHRTASRPGAGQAEGGGSSKGCHFFVEDEDEFGLDCLLQAMVFRSTGSAYVARRPWAAGTGGCDGFVTAAASELPMEAQAWLKQLEGAQGAMAPDEDVEL